MLYRESQEFIERRESASNRALCKQIRTYGELRQKCQVGHIQCISMRFERSHTLTKKGCCSLGEECDQMRIFGFYRDLRGVKRKCFLGLSIERAIASCDYERATSLNVRLYDVNRLDGYDAMYMGDGFEWLVYY